MLHLSVLHLAVLDFAVLHFAVLHFAVLDFAGMSRACISMSTPIPSILGAIFHLSSYAVTSCSYHLWQPRQGYLHQSRAEVISKNCE